MYKLLIVDDQKPVRDGLRTSVNWNNMGFEIAGDVESAEKALRMIEQEPVDVLLTDIVMDEMNGLSLIKEAKAVNPYIKSVILSGYNEFQYAKEAIRLGAYDFLTKPVSFSELHKIFENIKAMLDSEESDKESRRFVIEVKREKMLNNLAKGSITVNEAMLKDFQSLGVDLSASENFLAARVKIIKAHEKNKEDEVYDDDITNIKNTIIEKFAEYSDGMPNYHFDNDTMEVSFIFCLKEEMETINKCFIQLADLAVSDKFVLHIGIGGIVKDKNKIHKSFTEAGKALEHCLISANSCIMSYPDDVVRAARKTSSITEKKKEQLMLLLNRNDKEGFNSFLEGIISDELQDKDQSMKGIFETCIEILLIINKSTYGFYKGKNHEEASVAEVGEIYKKENIDDIKEFVSNEAKKFFDLSESMKKSSSGLLIDNVKLYLGQHCAEDITLNKTAELFYVHHTHLSRLFKEKTGENFSEFLTRIRIEKSKKLLLNPSLKIYDISEMVGYDSPKYFSKTFKDYVGITPVEYRNKH